MKNITVEKALEEFKLMNLKKGLSDETKVYYATFLKYFIEWLPHSIKKTKQLTLSLYDKYLLYLNGHYQNKQSVNTSLRALRTFLNFCFKQNYTVPFVIQLLKVDEVIKPTMSDDELLKIVLNSGTKKQDVIALVLISTAIRSKTLCNIHVEDIDFREKTLLLRHLKNRKQAILVLPDFVLIHLSKYIMQNNLTRGDFLFLTLKGNQYNRHSLYKLMCNYFKRKEFENVGIHILRRTFSKNFARNGGSSILLSRLLTHSTVGQSEHYVGLYGKELEFALQYNPVEVLTKKSKNVAQKISKPHEKSPSQRD